MFAGSQTIRKVELQLAVKLYLHHLNPSRPKNKRTSSGKIFGKKHDEDDRTFSQKLDRLEKEISFIWKVEGTDQYNFSVARWQYYLFTNLAVCNSERLPNGIKKLPKLALNVAKY